MIRCRDGTNILEASAPPSKHGTACSKSHTRVRTTHYAWLHAALTAVKTGNAPVGIKRAEGDGETGAVAVLVVDLMNYIDLDSNI